MLHRTEVQVLTFGPWRTAPAELKDNAVRFHRFLLVTLEKFLQASKTPLGSSEIVVAGHRPGDQAVLVLYILIRLTENKEHDEM